MKKICLCIPIYNETPTEDEMISLRWIKKNAEGLDIFYIKPRSLKLDGYIKYQFKHIDFPDRYFKNENTYSRLLLTCSFYNKFIDYEYILICQTDALLLKPFEEWKELLQMDYDYIGAPWVDGGIVAYNKAFKGVSYLDRFLRPKTISVGNGGFSLRKVSSCIEVIKRHRITALQWNTGEDVFFSYYFVTEKKYSIPSVDFAYSFACEKDAKARIQMGMLPVGVHAWKKYFPEIVNMELLKADG